MPPTDRSRHRPTARRALGTALLLLHAPATAAVAVAPSAPDPGPRAHASLPPKVAATLRQAYPIARDRVENSAACAALFDDLRMPGTASLERMRFLSAPPLHPKQPCRSATAYTTVNSFSVRLCRSFSRLPDLRAAAVLIHEALHTAGLPESRAVSDTMSSGQINVLVSERCGL